MPGARGPLTPAARSSGGRTPTSSPDGEPQLHSPKAVWPLPVHKGRVTLQKGASHQCPNNENKNFWIYLVNSHFR